MWWLLFGAGFVAWFIREGSKAKTAVLIADGKFMVHAYNPKTKTLDESYPDVYEDAMDIANDKFMQGFSVYVKDPSGKVIWRNPVGYGPP